MSAMDVVLLHGATGLLDELIMFGLPLVIFGALYLWSTRQERKRKKDEARAADAAAGRTEK